MTSRPTIQSLAGVVGDGCLDLTLCASRVGTADLNLDGSVGGADLGALLGGWG